MRDFQFGEFLTSLRLSSGYSQFQLGKLLGVSDKAVSKWETGAAKPRTVICAKLALIYGITLDELMSCRQDAGTSRMQGAQGQEEESLWQAVRLRLKKIYGDKPPVAFASRLDAEEVLMRGTGMIEHLKLKATLWQNGVCCDGWYTMESSLTAWLLGSAFINPLPPHTVCPACKKTVLHPEVRDGWDLPEGRCACGEMLIRDGHGIPLSLTEKRFQEMDRGITVSITQKNEAYLRRLICAQYHDRWKLVEYCLAQGEGSLSSAFEIAGRYYALIPDTMKLPYPLVDGKYQLPSDDHVFHLTDVPESLLYIGIDPDEAEKNVEPALSVPSLRELICADAYRKAEREIRTVDDITLGMLDGYAIPLLVPPDFVDSRRDFDEILRFKAEDISAWLPEQITFSTIMQVSSINFNRLWHLYARDQVMSGTASLMDYPISEEDIFDHVRRKMLQAGILDSGIALKAIASLRNHGPSAEVAQSLLDIGCEPWLPDYIRFASKHLFRESKARMVMSACFHLFRAAVREQLEANGEKEDKLTLSSLLSSTMMRQSIAHRLPEIQQPGKRLKATKGDSR